MRFGGYPMKGGEPAVVGALPEGGLKELLKMWGLRGGPERPQGRCRPKERCGGRKMRR